MSLLWFFWCCLAGSVSRWRWTPFIFHFICWAQLWLLHTINLLQPLYGVVPADLCGRLACKVTLCGVLSDFNKIKDLEANGKNRFGHLDTCRLKATAWQCCYFNWENNLCSFPWVMTHTFTIERDTWDIVQYCDHHERSIHISFFFLNGRKWPEKTLKTSIFSHGNMN